MSLNLCPRCGLAGSINGTLNPGDGVYAPLFVPNHVNAFRKSPGVTLLRVDVSACVKCGLVWSELDAADLRELIQASGKPVARQHLDRILHGRDLDLPQTEAALDISAKIAEIDAIVMAGKTGEVTRRYRDITGVSWDQAIKDTRHWRDLGRVEKLALFGWAFKKPSMDDLSETIME